MSNSSSAAVIPTNRWLHFPSRLLPVSQGIPHMELSRLCLGGGGTPSKSVSFPPSLDSYLNLGSAHKTTHHISAESSVSAPRFCAPIHGDSVMCLTGSFQQSHQRCGKYPGLAPAPRPIYAKNKERRNRHARHTYWGQSRSREPIDRLAMAASPSPVNLIAESHALTLAPALVDGRRGLARNCMTWSAP